MEIRTKFKPNDYAYPIYLEGTEYKFFNSYICIDHIIITEHKIVCVSKWNEQFNEQDCFATKEEAQAECEKRNKGE